MAGHLLAVSSKNFEEMNGVLATSQGGIWVLHWDRAARLSYLDPALKASFTSPEDAEYAFGARLYGAPGDKVWLGQSQKNKLTLLNSKGVVEAERLGSVVLPDGRAVWPRPELAAPGDKRNLVCQWLDTSDQVTATIALQPLHVSRAVEDLADQTAGMDELGLVAGDGSCYTVWAQKSRYPVELRQGLSAKGESVVTRYGADGRATAQIVVPANPFGYVQVLDLSADGRLYFLSYGAESLSLVCCSISAESPSKTAKAFPTLTIDGHRYLPIQFLAAAQGWHVQWDGKQRAAIVLTWEDRAVAKVAVEKGQAVEYLGRLWVEEAVARGLCPNLAITMKGRVASLILGGSQD